MAKGNQILNPRGDELVIGLVVAVGADLDCVCASLQAALSQVRYTAKTIRISQLVHEIKGDQDLPEAPEDLRIQKHMDAGNKLRQALGRGDAMALLSIGAIRDERESITGDANTPAPRHVWVLRSLKNPAEVATLRTIYGRSFFLIGAYCPRSLRVQNLAMRIAASNNDLQSGRHRSEAEDLIRRDESEVGNKLGQNVRDTFPMADVFVDVSDKEEARRAIQRFVEIIFGHPFHTPTRAEHGIFLAYASALRSASLGRQVGAAIATEGGDIVAVGTNEVPKAGGGLYWPGDTPDRRDFREGQEINDVFKQNLLGDVIARLQNGGWLADGKQGVAVKQLLDDLARDKLMKDAHLMNIIEFMRCVHAEMAAIVDAARRGIAVGGAILYCTTFPCHECAKHIVAAGLQKVIYIEPYAKSLVSELYPDSIAVDGVASGQGSVVFQPFVGIAPRCYLDLFPTLERKQEGTVGGAATWDQLNAQPRFSPNDFGVKSRASYEAWECGQFLTLLREKGLALVEASAAPIPDDVAVGATQGVLAQPAQPSPAPQQPTPPHVLPADQSREETNRAVENANPVKVERVEK